MKHSTTSLWLSFALLFLVEAADAQILFGPKLGYQASWIRYAQLYDGPQYAEGYQFSPQVGAVYSFSVAKNLSFYSELYYAQRGKQERTTDLTTLMRHHDVSYHFVEVPLMLRISKPLNSSKKAPSVYFNAGPHVALWLAGAGSLHSMETYGSENRVTTDYSVAFSSADGQEDVLYAEDANRLQFGLNIGTGLLIPVNNKGHKLQVDFRYTYGSTFMGSDLDLEIGNSAVEENLSFGHSMASVSVAYAFYVDIWGLRKGRSVRRK